MVIGRRLPILNPAPGGGVGVGGFRKILRKKKFLEVQKEFGTFSQYMWNFVKNKPMDGKRKNLEDLPAFNKESIALARDLKKRGFKFLGPTIVYAHMQSIGMINDHVRPCFHYKELKNLVE